MHRLITERRTPTSPNGACTCFTSTARRAQRTRDRARLHRTARPQRTSTAQGSREAPALGPREAALLRSAEKVPRSAPPVFTQSPNPPLLSKASFSLLAHLTRLSSRLPPSLYCYGEGITTLGGMEGEGVGKGKREEGRGVMGGCQQTWRVSFISRSLTAGLAGSPFFWSSLTTTRFTCTQDTSTSQPIAR